MYSNIGGKIKILAKVLAWIGIIACFIVGVTLIALEPALGLVGFLIMILGGILSWISSFVLYGFGELVENSDILAFSRGRTKNYPVEGSNPQNHFYEANSSHKWRCPRCGNMISDSTCPFCNYTDQNV